LAVRCPRGALIWGLIWYPYRLLRDGGVDGVVAATATYAIAFVLGLLLLRRSPGGFTSSWQLLGLVGGVLLLANLLALFGLARVAANRAIVIMLSEIAVAALAAWLLAGEALAPREWIGGADHRRRQPVHRRQGEWSGSLTVRASTLRARACNWRASDGSKHGAF
jgi:hypothetical protein